MKNLMKRWMKRLLKVNLAIIMSCTLLVNVHHSAMITIQADGLLYSVDETYNFLVGKGAPTTNPNPEDNLSKESLERLKNYYNGMPGIISQLDLRNQSFGEGWIESVFSNSIRDASRISAAYIKRLVNGYSRSVLSELNEKLNTQKERLEEIVNEHPESTRAAEALEEVNNLINNANIDSLLNGDINDYANRVNENATDEAITAIEEEIQNNQNSQLDQAKQAAKDEVAQKADEKIIEINSNPNATQEEKQAAVDAVNAEKQRALNAIDQAGDTDAIATEKNQAIENIRAISVSPLAKDNARDAVNRAADAKIEEVNQNSEATAEEKAVAINEVNRNRNDALASIDVATTNEGVESAKNEGITNIENVTVDASAKDRAKQAVEAKAAEKIAEINSNPNATQEEKDAAIAEVNTAKNNALSAIDEATTNQGVESAKNEGIANIGNITVEADAKDRAKQAVEAKAAEKIAEINSNSNATQEEKNAAIAEVNTAKNNALSAIDEATTNEAVENAKNEGITNIENVTVEADAKDRAKQAVEAKAAEKIAEINANPNATQEEKDAAIAEVNTAKNNALSAIDEATTNQDVTDAKNEGITNIENVTVEADAKDRAKQAVEAKAAEKIAEINANPNATQEEKQTAIDAVNMAKNSALSSIDNATTNGEIETAKNEGITNIENVVLNPTVKQDARDAVEAKAAEKIAEINVSTTMTEEEKQAAIDEVNRIKDETIANIQNATTNAEVNEAVENGNAALNEVDTTGEAKQNAIAEVENKANEKIAEINVSTTMTEEEKQAAIDEVNRIKDETIANIQNATTNAEVNEAVENGNAALNEVDTTGEAKQNAIAEVENKANEKIAEINASTTMTEEEKQAAIDEVNRIKDETIANIQNATTNAEVNEAVENGNAALNGVDTTGEAKQNAKDEINRIADEKIAEINANPNATQEEKDAAIANINAKRDQALSAIDAATTNEGVENAKNDGIHNIDDITVDTSAKDNATSAITTKANEQIAKINASTTMTEEEKQAAIEKVKQIEEEYLEKINQAGSGQEVVSLIEEAKTKIESVDTVGVIKQEASEMINQMADEKIAMIQQDPEATEEEKQKAIDAVNEIRMAYLTKLDFAKTNQEVEGLMEQAKVDFEKVQIEYQQKANQTPNTADTSDVSRGLMMILFSLLASLGIILIKNKNQEESSK